MNEIAEERKRRIESGGGTLEDIPALLAEVARLRQETKDAATCPCDFCSLRRDILKDLAAQEAIKQIEGLPKMDVATSATVPSWREVRR